MTTVGQALCLPTCLPADNVSLEIARIHQQLSDRIDSLSSLGHNWPCLSQHDTGAMGLPYPLNDDPKTRHLERNDANRRAH
jgi:hypothetical protein